MDAKSTSKKSGGFFGDVKDLFGVGPGRCCGQALPAASSTRI
jgi:hypothetical protein